MTSEKITQEEMVELFGEEMPIEAANLLFDAPDDWTVDDVRRKLREIAALAARPAPEAGSVAVEDDGAAFDPYDLIRSQTAQIASLSAKVAEVDRLTFDLDALKREWDRQNERANSAEARSERLEKALRDLCAAYAACNGEDHPAYLAARDALQQEGESDALA